MQRRTPRLDDQLCFAVAAAHRAIVAAYQPLLDPLGLTHPQYLALLALFEQSPQRMTSLAQRLFLDNGTMTPLVRRLEARGLVARRRAVDDERVVEIHLTAAGRAFEDKVKDLPHAVACAGGVDVAQLGALRDTLQVLTQNLRAAPPAAA